MAIIELLGEAPQWSVDAREMRILAQAWSPEHEVRVAKGPGGWSFLNRHRSPGGAVRIGWGDKAVRGADWVVLNHLSAPIGPRRGGDRIRWVVPWDFPVARDLEPLVLPYPIPPEYFAPGDGALVFEAARRFHLEERPRLVYGGRYDNGRRLTRLLALARQVLAGGGELILLDSAPFRPSLAPVVAHLGLAERVVFLPPLPDDLMAGIFHGADLFLMDDGEADLPIWAHFATAAGLPIVGEPSPVLEAMTGRSLLAVTEEEAWANAVTEALDNGRLRERMIERATEHAKACHRDVASQKWLQALGAAG